MLVSQQLTPEQKLGEVEGVRWMDPGKPG